VVHISDYTESLQAKQLDQRIDHTDGFGGDLVRGKFPQCLQSFAAPAVTERIYYITQLAPPDLRSAIAFRTFLIPSFEDSSKKRKVTPITESG
jgi:hypothetical protein